MADDELIEVSEEEIQEYIRKNKTILEYSCWGPNKWHKPSREEARAQIIAQKKKE